MKHAALAQLASTGLQELGAIRRFRIPRQRRRCWALLLGLVIFVNGLVILSSKLAIGSAFGD